MPKTSSSVSETNAKALSSAVRTHLGKQLRALYGDPADDKLPRDLAKLAERVAQVIRAHTEPVDEAFIQGVMQALPNLRAFALSLTGKLDQAEDLVQDTVLKALTKQELFEAGTNLQAWLFTILRNGFYSTHRKTSREIEDEDGAHAAKMVAIPDQEDRLELQDLSAALYKLPDEQREAIILVGAEGLSYEDAAAALGVKVGTIKSRVNRARNRLAELLGSGGRGEGGASAGNGNDHRVDPR
ncbi:sigma-70 family RNA polymerase sigma factor [Microvirga roseola]|uniref:sigma-70 family RNA polymerase sigma factor n=1 Tax=Microvirga roseola TaxID=2883126 RepID=UPI001E64B7FB|nr:sigma-70 family RNA polymerase sigma factor [Microvirga roseola]